MSFSSDGSIDEATSLANVDLKAAGTSLTAELNDMRSMNKDNMASAISHQDGVYNQVTRTIIIAVVVAAIVLLFVVWVCWTWVCKRLININKQLRGIITTIEEGHGDLTRRVQCFCTDEIGTLASGINIFFCDGGTVLIYGGNFIYYIKYYRQYRGCG